MCGISGIFDPSRVLPSAQIESDVRRMIGSFRYRGPDGEGTHFDPSHGLGLGHVRLSIIDVDGGRQPMSDSDGNIWIVFNGEIYNFHELRKLLESEGASFRTKSDTEVIIAMYRFYGHRAWERLRGQFAIGLWDKRSGQVHLVRDRIGEKPLFYCERNGALYFASELKALLKCQDIPRRLDPDITGMYLLTTHVPAPFSLIQGIKKLVPGHFLTFDLHGTQTKRYWTPVTWPEAEAPASASIVADFRARFEEAVRLCTVSDVPIGTYLSGGLDSTAVTWGVTRVLSQPFHSFAIFNRENYEGHPDWSYAQEAAAHLKTTHHNVFYTLDELMGLIPEYIEKTDEPFHGPTNLVSYLLAKRAREHVKVVLTGNGADELLGGYESYYRRVFKSQKAWQAIDRYVPSFLRGLIGGAMGKFHPKFARVGLSHEQRRIETSLVYHRKWFDFLCPEKADSIREKLGEALGANGCFDQKNYIKRYLFEDLLIYHQHSVTTMPDATGMACSLEARNPFLDQRLVEFIFSLPPEMLIRPDFNNKYVLLKAVESMIPSSILYRKKEGFSGMTGAQIVSWIRTAGRPVFREALMESSLAKAGYFDKAALAALWNSYEQAPSVPEAIYFQIPMWSTVMLELWYRRHILN